MRSLEDIRTRWRQTQSHSPSVAHLQRAVRYNGDASPCVSGCRSVCWKTFLLFSDESGPDWSQVLLVARTRYAEARDHLLKFIKHPEALTELTIDPLADDPDSPWNTVRQDELIRAEILQDVQRLPDEVNYHEDYIQTMILDILFVYCKLHPGRGGYRQGMHELLAPMVYVVEQDAIDRAVAEKDTSLDFTMFDMLDSSFIEHDAYALFAQVMEQAQSFYELKEPSSTPSSKFQEQSSTIVERSKFIHEVCLDKIDPELAAHLTNIEILPQIFLIRWVRLLFSREFPFEQFLVLWDTLFAIDPALNLIDLICVAMLIRIRWQLLEADYSVCLQLLLKYPPPAGPHGPQTFADDAVYLRDHMNASGGASLIMKYTGRMPTISKSSDDSRSSTPNFAGLTALRQRGFGGSSPLASPSRFNQAGMEALFQGAAKGAKGVLQRSEKLGINQAVKDAMGEIRRNMQGFNDSKYPPRNPSAILDEEGATKALAAMERRNKQLASMLDETVADLRAVSTSGLEEKAKSLELIEVAAAKVQFVQIYLEDSSMEVPTMEGLNPEGSQDGIEEKEVVGQINETPDIGPAASPPSPSVNIAALSLAEEATLPKQPGAAPHSPSPEAMETESDAVRADPLGNTAAPVQRPAPIPTRSTLAQSSFSWMLEPEAPVPSQSHPASRAPPGQHKKRVSNNASRQRNAFLFGEVIAEADGRDVPNANDIFGLETMDKGKAK